MELLLIVFVIWAIGHTPGVADALRRNKNDDLIDIFMKQVKHEEQKQLNKQRKN